MPGLVSTIIPVYNRPAMLKRAVDSVLQQTYRPIEIIIVNDGSTDNTGRVTNELAYEHKAEIIALHQANAGPGNARETGRKVARGEFIQYLDSDDMLLPDKFQCQVAGLRECPECGVSYGKTHHHQLSSDTPWKQTGEKFEFMFPTFLKQRIWSTPTPLYRRTVTNVAGPWTNLRQEEDWEYDCRIASQGIRLHFCDRFIAEIGTEGINSLSTRWSIDPEYMKDRVKAHELIFEHAKRAGINDDAPEMQHFARELFLIARQCGNVDLKEEAKQMFDLSRVAAGSDRANGLDYIGYMVIASLIGWTTAGKLFCTLDRFKK